MADKQKTETKNEEYTILLMKDITSEPIQFKVKVNHLKMALVLVITIPLVLSISLVTTGTRCVIVDGRYKTLNEDFKVINSQYCASDHTLEILQERVLELELNHQKNCERAENVISGLEKDLVRWLPEGAVGGEQLQQDLVDTVETSPLSPSQVEKVQELEQKLEVLDSRLDDYSWVIDGLEESYETKNNIFEAIPSVWPLKDGFITSRFGMRVHPITRKLQMHSGIDIAANYGTVIHATAPGIVTFTGRKGGYGKAVKLDHGYGLSSFYAHCQKILVKSGHSVKKGQPIALVGSTGSSTGPHVHFEVRLYGAAVNPTDYLSPFAPGLNNE